MRNQTDKTKAENLRLLLSFLDALAPEDSIKLVYTSSARLQSCFPNVKLPNSFSKDYCHLAEIYRLSRDVASVNELSDPTCNIITAILAEMGKADRLVSALVYMAVDAIRDNNFLEGSKRCLELFDVLGKFLRAIIYATGGEPTNLPSAMVWQSRIHLMYGVLGTALDQISSDTAQSLTFKYSSFPSKLEPELFIVESIYRWTMQLADISQHSDAFPIAQAILYAAKNCFVPGLEKFITLGQLLMARCLVGMGDSDKSIGYFCSFVLGADDDVLRVLDVSISIQTLRDIAIYTVLAQPEVATCANIRWKVCFAMLPFVPPWENEGIGLEDLNLETMNYESFIRGNLYEIAIDALLEEGMFIAAHDRVMEILDRRFRGKFVGKTISYLLEKDWVDELCSLDWGEDRTLAETILKQRYCHSKSPKDFQVLHKWRISNGKFREAAECMYQFSRAVGVNEKYFGLQLCHSALSLVEEEFQWLATSIDGSTPTIVDLKEIGREMTVAKASSLLGFEAKSERELLLRLLEGGYLSVCIELLLDHPIVDQIEVVLGFLVDSCMEKDREKHWLLAIISEGMVDFDYDDAPELSILKYLLERLERDISNNCTLYALDQLLAYHQEVPEWLLSKAVHADPNRLFRILGAHEQLDKIACLLMDVGIRNSVTTGTTAYLQLLTKI